MEVQVQYTYQLRFDSCLCSEVFDDILRCSASFIFHWLRYICAFLEEKQCRKTCHTEPASQISVSLVTVSKFRAF